MTLTLIMITVAVIWTSAVIAIIAGLGAFTRNENHDDFEP